MKKLRLTMNGKVYELTVEVLEDDEQYVTGGNLPAAPRLRSASASGPAPATPRTAAPNGTGGKVDPDTIRAPIAGTVQKIFVRADTHVEEKTPIIMLDAMKMDTYIHAPRTGDVAEVCVELGETVQVGTVLIRYRPES